MSASPNKAEWQAFSVLTGNPAFQTRRHCGLYSPGYKQGMLDWSVVTLMLISATITALSFRANREASRTGRLRFLFWHIPGWGERAKNPTFFQFGQAQDYFRTFLFAFVTVLCGVYILEALGGSV